ncbi:MAG: sigma-B regulation protein RsbU (phosphoserine phosphatase) [Planctomycetota bacterium]|jgi:sigma-B regulation protein RsbU (phosphoserine phosphatase)
MWDQNRSVSLVVERDDQPTRRILLAGAVFRIGRSRDNDLELVESHVSKFHAEIRREQGGFVIVDLGSLAGVLINDSIVKRHRLAYGDTITLGPESPVRISFQRTRDEGITETTLVVVAKDDDRGSMGRLARFFQFSRKLRGGISPEEVLQDVVDLAIDVTRAERGMVILLQPDGSLDKRAARAQNRQALPANGLRVSETLVRNAFKLGKPKVIEDVSEDANLAHAESVVRLELRSAVTLPLLRFEIAERGGTTASKVFGLIYLDSRRQRGSFDGFDLRILERLAQDASSVIENARLLGEAEDKKRIDRELKLAGEVQAALMPEQFLSSPTFGIAGVCQPCHELGGDYYDQFDLGGGRQALVVADVCGKGISASLPAATLQGALAAEIAEPRPLGEVVARVNRVHCRLAPVGKFITMVVLVLEPDGTVCLVNAGHCPVLHAHADGISSILTDGMALGLDADADFRDHTMVMQPGDTLLVCTDGVGECEGPARDLFGDARLEQVLHRARHLPPPQIVAEITGAVDAFRGDVAVSDDTTVLVVRRL